MKNKEVCRINSYKNIYNIRGDCCFVPEMVGGLREVWVRQEKGYIMDTSYRMYLKRAGIRSGNMKVLYAVCVRNDAAEGRTRHPDSL